MEILEWWGWYPHNIQKIIGESLGDQNDLGSINANQSC